MSIDDKPSENVSDPSPASRYTVSLARLEAEAHVPAEDQIIEIPGVDPGRSPGDDDLSRQQRDALRAGG